MHPLTDPAALRSLADEFWDDVLATNPTFATILGDRRFDDRFDDVAPAALADVVRRPKFAATTAARQLVADQVLASQVAVGLAGHRDLRRHRVDVESTGGVVTLGLPAGADPDVALAVARGVTGVQSVKLRIAEIPVVTPFPG